MMDENDPVERGVVELAATVRLQTQLRMCLALGLRGQAAVLAVLHSEQIVVPADSSFQEQMRELFVSE
jgi:hypothetical protein